MQGTEASYQTTYLFKPVAESQVGVINPDLRGIRYITSSSFPLLETISISLLRSAYPVQAPCHPLYYSQAPKPQT